MSRIYGTNDRQTLEEKKFPSFQIQLWKGSRKQDFNYVDKQTGQQKQGQKFGKDLAFEFRIELNTAFTKNNPNLALVKTKQVKTIKNILKQCYKAREDENGSLFVECLNVIPYCNDPTISFFSALATYKNNKPQWFCDKKTIHTKFIGDRGRPVKTKEPCHAKSIYGDCPKRCKEFGSFYFEILELAMLDITRVCRLQVSGIEDIITISNFLDKTQKELGAIRKSPFYSTRTRNFIVYRLSRHAKQNSYKKINHPVLLELHPVWANEYNSYLLAQQIQSLGGSVPRKVLAEIYGENLIEPADIQTIEVESNDREINDYRLTINENEDNVNRPSGGARSLGEATSPGGEGGLQQKTVKYQDPQNQARKVPLPAHLYPLLATQDEWKPSRLDIEEVRSLLRGNNWSQEELLLMLRSRFGIQEIKEIQTFNQEQFEQFKEALKC